MGLLFSTHSCYYSQNRETIAACCFLSFLHHWHWASRCVWKGTNKFEPTMQDIRKIQNDPSLFRKYCLSLTVSWLLFAEKKAFRQVGLFPQFRCQFANTLGRRRALLITATLFVIAPLLSALAPDYLALLFGRTGAIGPSSMNVSSHAINFILGASLLLVTNILIHIALLQNSHVRIPCGQSKQVVFTQKLKKYFVKVTGGRHTITPLLSSDHSSWVLLKRICVTDHHGHTQMQERELYHRLSTFKRVL